MVKVITDMQLIEAIVSYERTHGREYPDLEKDYYRVLFDQYSLSPSQIKSSLDYYTTKKELMSGIYDDALSILSKKEAVLERKKQLREAKQQFERLKKEFEQLNLGGSFREDSIAHLCINPVI